MASRANTMAPPPANAMASFAVPLADAPTLLDMAKQKYPYLAAQDLGFVSTPNDNDPRTLEFYPPGETGDVNSPRPSGLPLNKPGVQVFHSNTKPDDLLADFVSHYAANVDPKLKALYQQFASSLDPQMMLERYKWAVKNEGEDRPFDQWMHSSGVPSAFRGYTFRQWPDEFNARFYTPDQIKTLDKVRAHVGFK